MARVSTVKVGDSVILKDGGALWLVTAIGIGWVTVTSPRSGVQYTLSRSEFEAEFSSVPAIRLVKGMQS